jgi:hypothetical protein
MISQFLRSVSGAGAVVATLLVAACSSEKPSIAGDTTVANTPRNVALRGTLDRATLGQDECRVPEGFGQAVEATGTSHSRRQVNPGALAVSGPATHRRDAGRRRHARPAPRLRIVARLRDRRRHYRKAQSAYRNAKRIADRDSVLFKNDTAE